MRCIVVGAGLAGLVAAHMLRRNGVATTVFEADRLPGGKVRTYREEGYLIEWGPQGFLDEEGTAFRRAIGIGGLEEEVLAPRPEARLRYVLRRGKPRLMPSQVHRILSGDGLVRALREPLVPRGRRIEAEDETVLAWARRRVGPEAAERLFDTLVSGVFAGDPGLLSLKSAFPRIHELESGYRSLGLAVLRGGFKPRPLKTFRRGMGQLPEALAAKLGDDLRLRTPVEALERSLAGEWTVRAGGETHRADAVLLATPIAASARLLGPLDADLADEIAAIPAAPIAVVVLGYRLGAFRDGPPAGFGFLVPRREGLRTLGCLYPTGAFDGTAPTGAYQLRLMIGGRRDPAAVRLDDEALLALVRQEVEPILRISGEPALVRIYRHLAAIPQYEVGHARRLRRIDERCRRLTGLHLAGSAYRGISVVDVTADAERVAREVSASRLAVDVAAVR